MKLKAYRKLRALTLEDVGVELKVSAGTVCRWENGAIPKKKQMEEIFRVTSGAVSPNDFYLSQKTIKVDCDASGN